MRFSDVVGNDIIKHSLRDLADNETLPHALMISGPNGIGKLRMARAFAQYIHCQNRSDGDSCGICPSCRQHQTLNFPDLHFIYPVIKKASRSISSDYYDEWKDFIANNPFTPLKLWGEAIDTGNTIPSIYVNEADDLIRTASLSSYSADLKIYIIWLPEKMQTATANKILKLIEEPHHDTIFIMVSDDPSSILPTILSRTRRYEMKRLPEEEIAQWLNHDFNSPLPLAREAARLAEGAPAKALEIALSNDETNGHKALFQQMMRMAYSCNGPEMKAIADNIAGMGRQKTQRFFDYCQRQIRENFITNFNTPSLNLQSEDEMTFSQRFAPFIHFGNVQGIMDIFSNAANDIARNANAKIVCFDLILKLMNLLRMPRN